MTPILDAPRRAAARGGMEAGKTVKALDSRVRGNDVGVWHGFWRGVVADKAGTDVTGKALDSRVRGNDVVMWCARWGGVVASRVACACVLLLLAGVAPARASDEVTVFAAASLTDALAEVGRTYERASGDEIDFSFASSSTLARQIAQGAPADIYLSANLKWMDYVQARGKILARSRLALLANQLALVAPVEGAIDRVAIAPGFDLQSLLGQRMLAMGNPMHVPAGIYGKQALQSLGVWVSIKGQVARAANVRAALALVALGEAPLGIVYSSDAKAAAKVKIVGIFPAGSHKPIIYPAALTTRAGRHDSAAQAFFRFLTSNEATAIFERYGFKVLD